MSNEEKFKENLHQKLSEERFEFDASNWAGAEALLDADKKGKRGLYFLIPLLLILGGVSTYLFWPTTENKAQAIYANKKSNEQTAPVVKEMKPTSTPIQANGNVLAESRPSQSLANKREDIVTQAKINNTLATNNDKEKELNQPINIKSPEKELPSKMESHSPAVTNNQPNVKNELNEENNTNATTIKAGFAAQNPNIQPTASITGTQEEPKTKRDDQLDQLKTAAAAITLTNEVKSENKPEPEVMLAATKAQEGSQNPAPQIESVLPDTTKKLDPSLTAAINPSQVPLPSSFLFLELGTQYNLGWKHLNHKEGYGFNPLLGLFLQTEVFKSFGFNFGLQYTQVGGFWLSSKTSKVTRYGLGEESSVTVITPNRLHYLYVPFNVSYTLKEKNVFTLGYKHGYLFNVESKVESYNEHFTYNDNYKTYRTGGYTEGFEIFDSQISAGYRRKLLKDFWVSADVYLGLKDIKNNVFFNTNVFERTKGIKISLMYNVFKK